ncbi:tyrosine kinase domain protein, partial [Rhizoctonia solani AG-3 Rhs1AP]
MTRAYEASNIMTRPLDESPHAAAAHHYLLSVEGTADSAKGDKPSVNKSAASFVPAEFASTIQHPNETMDILQSQSPHGCLDLESSIDPSGFSSSAVAEGGFGDVWTGRTHNGGTKLAIKVLRFASLTGDTAKKELKRVTREIYNWSKPDHENINKLIGVFMFRERLGMVSEWMEHGNLRQYLGRNDDADCHQLCVQIARGVAYLHSINMVHGDLKACNILVSSTGILKITDFDYSIFPECSLAFSATSRMGGGTLRWMAPELLLDEEPPQRNLKTDIYALGMTFLETITNAHPYSECRHDHQIYRKLSHMHDEKVNTDSGIEELRGDGSDELDPYGSSIPPPDIRPEQLQ